jgi:hypothetical protein
MLSSAVNRCKEIIRKDETLSSFEVTTITGDLDRTVISNLGDAPIAVDKRESRMITLAEC